MPLPFVVYRRNPRGDLDPLKSYFPTDVALGGNIAYTNVANVFTEDQRITDTLDIYNTAGTEYARFVMTGGNLYIRTIGASPGSLNLQHTADDDINCFSSAVDGEHPEFRVYGWYSGAGAAKHLAIEVGDAGDGIASFHGDVSQYNFYSSDGTDYIGIRHDASNGYINWDDGSLVLVNTETDTNGIVYIRGNGTGYGILRIYNAANNAYLTLSAIGTAAYMNNAYGVLNIQNAAEGDVTLFQGADTGEHPSLIIYGDISGTTDTLNISVNTYAVDTADFHGSVGYYRFWSSDDSDYLSLRHDGTDVYIQTDDGNINIQNTEASGDFAVNINSTGSGEGVLQISGEMLCKVFDQAGEPSLGADNRFAWWKDSDDSDRIYLIFRRGSGDNVVVELTAYT
jgi:hypothetical protein